MYSLWPMIDFPYRFRTKQKGQSEDWPKRLILFAFIGRSDRIRTCDPCVPNAVLYQAELHSDVRKNLMISLNCEERQL
jgi:hypothetical protein